MSSKPLAVLLVSAVPLFGCGGGDSTAVAPAVRDSAGIRIVENAAPSLSGRQAWKVTDPVVEIGVVAGELAQQLDRVIGAGRLRDGRIVVANGGTNELRFFDAKGRHLKTAGGRGGGPGEFRRMLAFGRVRGDTIIVSDTRAGIVSRFDGQGVYLEKVFLDLPGGDPPRFLPDGSLLLPLYESGGFGGELELFAAGTRTAEADGLYRPEFELLRFGAGAETADTIGRFVGGEIWKLELGGGVRATRPRPFARHHVYSPAGDGVVVMHNDRPEIRRFAADGTLEMIIRFEARPPAAISAADRTAVRDSFMLGINPASAPRFERWLGEVPYPPTRPIAQAVVGGTEGSVWLQEGAAPAGGLERWSIFGADGTWLQRVDLPAGTVPLEIGADYLLGLWRDELDVEFVRLHRITKPGS